MRKTILIATSAIILTTSGTALAGGYIITSTKQIKPSVRHALTGQRGPQGPSGQPGSQGAPGPAALPNVVTVSSGDIVAPAGEVTGAQAYCPAGTKVIGTAFDGSIGHTGFVHSYDTFVGGGFINDASFPITVSVQAICTTTVSDRMLRNHVPAFENDLEALKGAQKGSANG